MYYVKKMYDNLLYTHERLWKNILTIDGNGYEISKLHRSLEQTMMQGFMFKGLWPCTMYNVLFCPHGKYLVSILSFWADKVVGEGAYSNIQLTWLEYTLYTNNVTKTHFLASLWKVNDWWLCSVHCQGQKFKQKHQK